MAANYYGRFDDGSRVPPITRRRPTLACLRCRTRRVKCDRAVPACGNCAKAGHACLQASNTSISTPVPHRVAGFRRDPDDNHSRLSKLEEEVQRLSREVNSHSPADLSSDASPVESSGPSEKELQGVVVGMPQSRYFSPYSWAAVSEELADIHNMLGGGGGGITDFSPISPSTDSSHLHAAFSGRSESSLAFVNPELSSTLVRLYARRVDPMIRLLHLPSFYSRLQSYQGGAIAAHPSPHMQLQNPISDANGYPSPAASYATPNGAFQSQRRCRSPNRDFEVLLTSVYYAAIISVIADPNPPYLGEDVDISSLAATLKREVAMQMAMLDDAELIRNSTLEILQAMVLMLSVDPRSSNPRAQWIRLGSATRIAQTMGLHRDPEQYGLKPVEAEVRRRIWAQICMLDVKFAEELGCEPTIMIGSYDTCLPSSVSDEELTKRETQAQTANYHPSLQVPTERHSPEIHSRTPPANSQSGSPTYSLMTFSLIRYEAARVSGRLFFSGYEPKDSIFRAPAPISRSNSRKRLDQYAKNSSMTDKVFWINLLEDRFAQVYNVQSLDQADPMQAMVARVAQISVAKARFVVELQRWKESVRSMNGVERDQETNRLLRDAVELSRLTTEAIYDPRFAEWYWYIKRFKEVYTSSFILFNLACGRNLDPADVEAAWQVIDRLFPHPAEGTSDLNGKSPLGRLLFLARARRVHQHGRVPTTGEAVSTTMSQPYPLVNTETTLVTPPHNGVSYQHPYAAFSGTMFEDMDFMMQDPLWFEASNNEMVQQQAIAPWGPYIHPHY